MDRPQVLASTRRLWFAVRVSVRSVTSAVLSVVAESLREAFVHPVQSGRVEVRVWPGHLRATIIAAYVVYGAMVLSVLLSPLALSRHPGYNDFGLSVWGALPVAVGLWASMVLLFLASLRLHVVWRLGAWALLMIPHGITWFSSLLVIGQGPWPLLSLLLTAASSGLGVVLLVVVVAIGRRGTIRVSTVVLTVIALTLSYLAPQLLSLRSPRLGSVGLTVTAIVLLVLAMPLAVAAGTAFAQIAINLSTSTIDSIRARAPARLWPILAPIVGVAVLAMPLFRNAEAVRDSGPAPVLASVGFTITSAALSAVGLAMAQRRARRRHAETGVAMSYPRPLTLSEILADVSTVLGILLGSWGITLLLGLVVPLPPLLREWPAEVADFLMAGAALVLAVRAVRRGRTAAAVLLPPVALMGVYTGLRGPLDLPTLLGSTSAATLAVGMGVVAIGWIRRGGGTHRWFVLCLGLVILLVFPFREELAEPLEALLGATQVGVLLVGLIWLLLTEAEFTRRGSPRFGRAARTLVFLAYALFTAVMMAAVAYATDDSAFRRMHLGELANIGDSIIGFAVAPAVIVGLLALGHRDIDPVGGSPESPAAP